MTSGPDRQKTLTLVEQARRQGARQAPACAELGVSERTVQRWRRGDRPCEDRRPYADRPAPSHRLTPAERDRILRIANTAPFQSLPPAQIVARLADEGTYVASESTMYRVLREAKQLAHRGARREPVRREPTTHLATAPNQVWMWDITWLRGPVKGLFYYLYMIMDLYSRKIVGWEVYAEENGEHAAELLGRAALREGLRGKPVILHADNGSPMKAATLLETMHRLNVSASYSRPRVSNDNAYAERLFGTAKYRPDYPRDGFDSIEAAQDYMLDFVRWYNGEHRHAGIGFVTPDQCHQRQADAVLAKRRAVYAAARQRHPRRWSRQPRPWPEPGAVELNPQRQVVAKPERDACEVAA